MIHLIIVCAIFYLTNSAEYPATLIDSTTASTSILFPLILVIPVAKFTSTFSIFVNLLIIIMDQIFPFDKFITDLIFHNSKYWSLLLLNKLISFKIAF